VEVCGVSKRYIDVAAVHDVTLTVYEAEFFSLLGPSGCGKTTTLNLIGGFIEPDQGTILIQGRPMAGIPPYRRPVNTVFQNFALFPHMSVVDNVAFGLRMKRVAASEVARRVAEMLALTSLVGLEHRRPSQLSGGQQQRVALARALVNRPAVLLLDEPLGALDLKLRKQMQLELSRIQREVGITFIYVTHDQEEAMTMSDRLAVMNQGRVAQVGTPQSIYERPSTRFVADFIGASNTLGGVIVGLEPGVAVVRLAAGAVIRAVAQAGAVPGQVVSLVIRPDRIDVHPQHPGEGRNGIRGRVTKVSFLGTHFQVVVASEGVGEITMYHRISPGAPGDPPAPGDEVYLSWRTGDALCFAE
jgi:spermidine/putrescine transport system ATP-binding protein